MCFEVLQPVVTLLTTVGGLITGGGMKEKTAPPPAPPAPKPPEPRPSPDDDAVRRARQRQAAAVQQRSGRASTLLTELTREKLG